MKGKDQVRHAHRGWRATLTVAIVVGLVVVVWYARGRPEFNVGLALLLAGGCLLIGGFLGFLFGIPRAPELARGLPSGGNQPPGAAAVVQERYRANTNLEEVSDWLTKILVGVGLTQLTSLPAQLAVFGRYFGGALGGEPTGERFAVAMLLYFAVAGFLVGYLWTRLFLGGALAEADLLSRVEERLDAQQLQARHDADSLALVGRQLQPGDGARGTSLEELKEAIKNASESVKIQIFYQAEAIRRENWRDDADKPLMERTIPIFEALTEADVEKRFHRSWAQLGYALKDQRSPDYRRAEAALSNAIRIRGDANEHGYFLYEFNRAFCRINLDPNYKAAKPSEPTVQNAIRADLDVAGRGAVDLVETDADIRKWVQLNPA